MGFLCLLGRANWWDLEVSRQGDSRQQGNVTISESRNEGQEGSALEVKQGGLYTCPVVPLSFDLFPVSSTGADSIVDHAKNWGLWAYILCCNYKLPSC